MWLWDAPRARGVSDDGARAKQAAEQAMRAAAGAARVERAILVSGGSAMGSGYRRLGDGWTGRPRGDGGIRWAPLPQPPA